MTQCLLHKTLDLMYHYCRNKILSVSFYEGGKSTTPSFINTRADLNRNVGRTLYKVSLSSGNITLQVYEFEPSLDQYILVARDDNFKLKHLYNLRAEEFTIHTYEEAVAFSRTDCVVSMDESVKYSSECIKSDNNLLVNTFKVLGDSLTVTLSDGTRELNCFYVSNKLYFLDVVGSNAYFRVLDLFNIGKYYPNFHVIDYVAVGTKLNGKFINKRLEEFARNNNLNFIES